MSNARFSFYLPSITTVMTDSEHHWYVNGSFYLFLGSRSTDKRAGRTLILPTLRPLASLLDSTCQKHLYLTLPNHLLFASPLLIPDRDSTHLLSYVLRPTSQNTPLSLRPHMKFSLTSPPVALFNGCYFPLPMHIVNSTFPTRQTPFTGFSQFQQSLLCMVPKISFHHANIRGT